VLLAIVGLVNALLTAVPWWGNPFAGLVPQAYVVAGLVPVTVASFVLFGVADHPRGRSAWLCLVPFSCSATGTISDWCTAPAIWDPPTRTNERVGSGRDPPALPGARWRCLGRCSAARIGKRGIAAGTPGLIAHVVW
jgi:hypothetical protein